MRRVIDLSISFFFLYIYIQTNHQSSNRLAFLLFFFLPFSVYYIVRGARIHARRRLFAQAVVILKDGVRVCVCVCAFSICPFFVDINRSSTGRDFSANDNYEISTFLFCFNKQNKKGILFLSHGMSALSS